MIQVPEELCEWGSRAYLKRLRVGNFKLKSLRSCGHTGREFGFQRCVQYLVFRFSFRTFLWNSSQCTVSCTLSEVKFSQILLTSLFAGSRSVWSCVKVPEMHIEKKKKNLCRKVEFWVEKSSSGRLNDVWLMSHYAIPCSCLKKVTAEEAGIGFHSCLLFIEALARLF